MPKLSEFVYLFESLVGEKLQKQIAHESINISLFNDGDDGIGYSQFNELLILLGFDRVNEGFFNFLSEDDMYTEIESPSINSIEEFNKAIDRFTELALLFYGNLKFAFKVLSKDEEILFDRLESRDQVEVKTYKLRHNPIIDVEPIPKDKTFYLGYLINKEINKRFEKEPENAELKRIITERLKYVEIGKRNQIAYLVSDNIDVYVATSMRFEHEFVFVNQLVNKIFHNSKIKDLKLRWFDPTQAYCDDRVDKGVSEALMLKRAKCTLYLAQETDTLGKDSELASTLAQGKPVIAFVPKGDKTYVDDLISNLKKSKKGVDERVIILNQIKIFKPCLAWDNDNVKTWIKDPSKVNLVELKKFFTILVKEHYDKRASTFTSDHPLGIQVNLHSGVANGVLVVRTIKDCVSLLKGILLNSLEFDIERKVVSEKEYIYLRERISKCIFRLKTGDVLLTNSFWNYYI